MLHEEADRISTSPAAKTLIDLFGGGDGERRRFFVVERTEAEVIGAPFFELYETTYDLDNVGVLKSPPYQAIGGENSSPWTKRTAKFRKSLLRYEGEQLFPGDLTAPPVSQKPGDQESVST